MSKLWRIQKAVLRAAIWKATPRPGAGDLISLIISCLIFVTVALIYEYFAAGKGVYFVPYGLNATIASIALFIAASAFFVRPEARVAFASSVMTLSTLVALAEAIFAVLRASHTLGMPTVIALVSHHPIATSLIVQPIWLVWWGGAICAIMRSVEPDRPKGRIRRTAGLWLVLMAIVVVLPNQPTFRGADFQRQTSNWWEYFAAVLKSHSSDNPKPEPRLVDSEQVELAQPALLEAEMSALAPHIAGKANVYALGIAGWSDQGVFIKELDGGIKSLSQVLPLRGHVIRLINRLDTVGNTPIASLQNFAAAVHAIAGVMDRDRDVLLLFMTSHGSPDGVALLLSGEVYADLSPRDVAMILDSEGITNRIVIVSACYSGVFLKPLVNASSIVLTAADAAHPSFGCSDERDWTYFGDALFNHGLMPGRDLKQAFVDAKAIVGQWEARDGLTPSNPQGFFGSALTRKLAPVYLHPASSTSIQSAASR